MFVACSTLYTVPSMRNEAVATTTITTTTTQHIPYIYLFMLRFSWHCPLGALAVLRCAAQLFFVANNRYFLCAQLIPTWNKAWIRYAMF